MRIFHSSKNGSILLELLLSVFILAFALTLIVGSLISGARAIAYNAHVLEASIVLENQVTKELAKHYLIPASLASANQEKFGKFNYQANEESLEENLKRLRGEISFDEKGRKKKLSIETIVFLKKDE